MPPKPASHQSKDVDDAVQAMNEKLGSLQSQLLALQELQDSRHDSLQSLMQTLMDQLTHVSSHQQQPPTTVPSSTPTSETLLPSLPQHGLFPTSGPPPLTSSSPPTQSPTFPFPHPTVPPLFTHGPQFAQSFTSLPQNPPFFPPPTSPFTSPNIRPPKLQLTPFEDQDPLDWLFQADQFFQFYQIPFEQRLSMTAFYMKGDALGWFKWMYRNNQLTDWHSFTRALELRFGPSSYDNFQAELFKLKQSGSVTDYQCKFERLCNRVYGLTPDAILNCFISGLLPDIQRELAILKPATIAHAIGLAKLVEAKIKDSRPKLFRSGPFQPNTNNPRPLPTPPTPPSTNPPSLPIKRLAAAQLQERRSQGLCYNCDEKFIPGHKCATAKFLLLLDEEDNTSMSENPVLIEDLTEDDPGLIHFQLSLHAINGNPSPKALKFTGLIFGLQVTILVDTGSSHNIIQPRIANYLHLSLTPISPFSVMVGNGAHLNCNSICSDVALKIQGHVFVVPCYLIPIEGADIVLGLDWLSTLGQIAADFTTPKLSFLYKNHHITLLGNQHKPIQPATYHHITHLSHTHAISSCHLISIIPLSTQPPPSANSTPPSTTDLNHLPLEIQTILLSMQELFIKPKDLPPSRPHDHHINLLPNTNPVNVKPYRYPHHQKATISKLIAEMLEDGIIKPSHSPFSSLVLLVKKKDGSWRFCVDYRALNAVTIKDRFLIPTVDELLDELGNAKFFTKLDLRSGYHQIRVVPNDTYKTAFRTCDGHYEFLVLPFGLTNAPSTFQSAMNDLLRPYLRNFVLVFFDDILIYSSSFSDHLVHLRLILNLLVTNKFFAKFSKCIFAVKSVSYLGHIISAGAMTPDPDKIQAIVDWPEPRTLTSLRGFLGLACFYRKFIKGYAALATPLTDLLRGNKFTWTVQASAAFTKLKQQIADTPKLQLPNLTQPFQIETDASAVAIGAVLQQAGRPLAFFSKRLCPRMQQAPTYVCELFAGKANTVADALSRQDGLDSSGGNGTVLFALSSAVPKFYFSRIGW